MRRLSGRIAVEFVVWWALLFAFYLSSLTVVPAAEFVTGAVIAVGGAAFAVAGRKAAGARWRLPTGAARWLLLLPWAVGADTARAFSHALRPKRLRGEGGVLREFVTPDEPEQAANGRLAVGGAVLSTSPGSFFLDGASESGRFVVHTLVTGRPDLAREVADT